jgi:glycosyltransferase involved in cell wall biosynthesis
MPVLRLLTSMACGTLVVSNGRADPYPFRDEHLVRVDADALAAAILAHLQDEPLRRQKAEAACSYVTTELVWRPVVARVLQRARALRSTSTCKGMTL